MYEQTFTIGDGDVEVRVVFEATRFVPAKTYGPAEMCSPAEGGEVNICEIFIGDFEVTDLLAESVVQRLKERCVDRAAELQQDEDDTLMAEAIEARNARNG